MKLRARKHDLERYSSMKYLHTASAHEVMVKMEAFPKSIYSHKYMNRNKLNLASIGNE